MCYCCPISIEERRKRFCLSIYLPCSLCAYRLQPQGLIDSLYFCGSTKLNNLSNYQDDAAYVSSKKSGLKSNPRSLRIKERLKEAYSASDTRLSKATVTPSITLLAIKLPRPSVCIYIGLACIPGTRSEILIMSGATMATLINHGTSLPTDFGACHLQAR